MTRKTKWLSLALLVTLLGPYTIPVALAQESSAQVTREDKNQNGIPDDKEDDNHNGIPDLKEDYDDNGIPDFKEEDQTDSSASDQSSDEAKEAPEETSESSASDTPEAASEPESDAPASQPAADPDTDQSAEPREDADPDETAPSSEESTSSPSTEQPTDQKAADKDQKRAPKKAVPQAPRASKKVKKIQKLNQTLAKMLSPVPVPALAHLNQVPSETPSGLEAWYGPLDDQPTTPPTYTAYVEHWSGKDAYTHNLLSHRYGIKAQQLDGYLDSLGINYDRNRINGKLVLKWEKESGLDARAIIAIAMAESSLGTAGVATEPGANMFGYGAFDSNPNNAQRYKDSTAVRRLTQETIIGHKNQTFKIQDDKAKKLASGHYNPFIDGGVYFTDSSGTGRRRAQIMQDIDTYIDEHGGTPAIPEELKNLTGTMAGKVPTGFSLSKPIQTASYIASSYAYGQCTWYVYNRAHELGYSFDAYMGNGGDWQYKPGYETGHKPKVGAALSFSPGQAGADPTYGHVAIVEAVKSDGSILISESNAMGLGVVSYRTFSPAQANQFTYVYGKK